MGGSARRAERIHWPVRKFQLGAQPGEDLSRAGTAEERLEMMWPLALDAWALSGRPLPAYSRRETPVTVVRPDADPGPAPA